MEKSQNKIQPHRNFKLLYTSGGFVILLVLSMIYTACQMLDPKDKSMHWYDSLTLVPEERDNHAYTYTNKQDGFWTGLSRKVHRSGYQGWTVNEFHYLKDYQIFQDNKLLNREKIKAFRYSPHGFERVHADGSVETFVLLDSIDAIILTVESNKSGPVHIMPIWHQKLFEQPQVVGKDRPELIVSAEQFAGGSQMPLQWLGIRHLRQSEKHTLFVMALSDSAASLQNRLDTLAGNWQKLIVKRKQRIIKLLNKQYVNFFNDRTNKALRWAIISLDALITKQRGRGIWAGLPWFNNYWGRDTFIAFTGAVLYAGKPAMAREILRNFARFQEDDPERRTFGRIPNRITNTEIIYNTADGTWWFIRELYEYYLFSGDRAFLQAMYPVIKRAINGALQNRTDASGYLIHEAAETWMDAKGPDGAWSPRDNRAVEIQALWYTSLQIGLHLSKKFGYEEDFERWQKISDQIKANFTTDFWNNKRACLYDHLNPGGQPDTSMRPNQIFAITVPNLAGIAPLLSQEQQESVVQNVFTKLTFPYGVASLWQRDRNFHPWHHYPPYYVPDAAYHNGTVWTWLAGPVVSGLKTVQQFDAADSLLHNEMRQILENDAIGNYSELLDALPRKKGQPPQISGTVSQAWSLAEFIRNIYQDVVGYTPIAPEHRFRLRPAPSENKKRRFDIAAPFKDGFIDINWQENARAITIGLQSRAGDTNLVGEIYLPGKREPVIAKLPHKGAHWKYHYIKESAEEKEKETSTNWAFARPRFSRSFAALQQIDYDVLPKKQIYFPPQEDRPVLISADDPLQDDRGPNRRYVYPQHPMFEDGILDLRHFAVYDDQTHWAFELAFERLVDPGWHPAYGFQLTYAAVAIRDDSLTENRSPLIGNNANVRLPYERAYNRIIYIGGGFEIRNANDETLAAYVPMDERYPIGYVNVAQIRFRIEKKYLPGLKKDSPISVFIGGQDDHGGAGIGEFRAVRKEAGMWHGGGAEYEEGQSRVYDRLFIN